MVTLRFVWDQFSYHEDENDDLEAEVIGEWEGETIEEACDNAAVCFDWDDSDVYNGYANSELHETSRDLKSISIFVDGKWKEVDEKVYEYYSEAETNAIMS